MASAGIPLSCYPTQGAAASLSAEVSSALSVSPVPRHSSQTAGAQVLSKPRRYLKSICSSV